MTRTSCGSACDGCMQLEISGFDASGSGSKDKRILEYFESGHIRLMACGLEFPVPSDRKPAECKNFATSNIETCSNYTS